MQIIDTAIADVKLIKPTVFGDHRGYFYESFRKDAFEQLNVQAEFIQDNQSMSKKNILRGLHFQAPPYEQGKLVRVIKGSVIDVVVDIRKSSASYGKHVKVELNEDNMLQLWVPPGFAHGFLTLEDDSIFSYKCTQYYHRESEGAIYWNSELLGIQWGIDEPIISEKDQNAVHFKDFKTPFK